MSSVAFRDEILAEAKRARAVLVLEPAAAGGALKTARKGVGEFKITVHGRSAHAGVNPAAGANAIIELTRQLLTVQSFARPRRGLTLNVGKIEGGTRSNVVPECATAWIDVRIPRLHDRAIIEKRIRGRKPYDRGTRLEIEGGINRPPMERKMTVALFRKAHALGQANGHGPGRSLHRRRFRRQFYSRAGRPDSRRPGRGRRRSPRPPRAYSHPRITPPGCFAGLLVGHAIATRGPEKRAHPCRSEAVNNLDIGHAERSEASRKLFVNARKKATAGILRPEKSGLWMTANRILHRFSVARLWTDARVCRRRRHGSGGASMRSCAGHARRRSGFNPPFIAGFAQPVNYAHGHIGSLFASEFHLRESQCLH